jgi:hypothetical protein
VRCVGHDLPAAVSNQDAGFLLREEAGLLLRPVVGKELVTRSTAQGKAAGEVTFEIEGQLAGQITNVGGDQNTFLDESQCGSVFGRAIALLGLIVSLAGLAFLVVGGIETAKALPPPDWAAYRDYVATERLTVALILIVIGIVVGKIERVFARR